MSRAFSSPAPTLAHQASKSSTRSVSHRLSEQLNDEEVPTLAGHCKASAKDQIHDCVENATVAMASKWSSF